MGFVIKKAGPCRRVELESLLSKKAKLYETTNFTMELFQQMYRAYYIITNKRTITIIKLHITPDQHNSNINIRTVYVARNIY